MRLSRKELNINADADADVDVEAAEGTPVAVVPIKAPLAEIMVREAPAGEAPGEVAPDEGTSDPEWEELNYPIIGENDLKMIRDNIHNINSAGRILQAPRRRRIRQGIVYTFGAGQPLEVGRGTGDGQANVQRIRGELEGTQGAFWMK